MKRTLIVVTVILILGILTFLPIYKTEHVICGSNPELGCWAERGNLIYYISSKFTK